MVEKRKRRNIRFFKWSYVSFRDILVWLEYTVGSFVFSSLYFIICYWRYTFNSVESQIRILGDYAFILRDYELALSSYRLISTDYKLDKAWKRYAGVQVASMLEKQFSFSKVQTLEYISGFLWSSLIDCSLLIFIRESGSTCYELWYEYVPHISCLE